MYEVYAVNTDTSMMSACYSRGPSSHTQNRSQTPIMSTNHGQNRPVRDRTTCLHCNPPSDDSLLYE